MLYPQLHKEIDDVIWRHLRDIEPAIVHLERENSVLRADLKWIADNLENVLKWPKDKQDIEIATMKKRAKDCLLKVNKNHVSSEAIK